MKIEEANKYNIDDLEDFACDFDHGTMFVESVNYDSLEQKLAETKEKLEVAVDALESLRGLKMSQGACHILDGALEKIKGEQHE